MFFGVSCPLVLVDFGVFCALVFGVVDLDEADEELCDDGDDETED